MSFAHQFYCMYVMVHKLQYSRHENSFDHGSIQTNTLGGNECNVRHSVR